MKETSLRVLRGGEESVDSVERVKEEEEDECSGLVDWNVDISDPEPHAPDDEGKLLTALVRRTYIQHVERSLHQNYRMWLSSYGSGAGVELSESFISRCASQIEGKALRACMLANLYQHSIISLIKNIKKSTDSKKLYEDLLTLFNCSNKCDKSVQTESSGIIRKRRKWDQLPPASIVEQSDLDLNKVNSSVDVLNLNHSDVRCVGQFNGLSTDKSNLVPPHPVPDPFQAPPPPKFVLSYLPKNESFETKCSKMPNLNESSSEVSSSKIYDPEIDVYSEDRIIPTEKSKPALKRKSTEESSVVKRQRGETETRGRKRTLEERLKKFEEIFGESCEDVEARTEPEPPDKISFSSSCSRLLSLVSWKQEQTAQVCQLNRILLSVSPRRLRTLRVRFKRLFGSFDPVTDMTPDEFAHCRKRLANVIVFLLTPYFEKGQIGPRQVFKALAREITRIILTRTYASNFDLAKETVDEIFRSHPSFTTLEDVGVLCSC